MSTFSKNTFKQPFLSNKMEYFVSKRATWDGSSHSRTISFEEFSTNNTKNSHIDIFPDGYSAICFEIGKEGATRACYFGKITEPKITFFECGKTYFAIKIPPYFLFRNTLKFPEYYVNRVVKLENFTDAFSKLNKDVFSDLSFDNRIIYFQNYVKKNMPYKENELINYVLNEANKLYDSPKLIDIAKKLDVSDRYIRATFKRELGISPKRMIQSIRMKLTLKKIVEESHSVTDILMSTSFYDHPHFNKFFKSLTTYSPTELKKLIQ